MVKRNARKRLGTVLNNWTSGTGAGRRGSIDQSAGTSGSDRKGLGIHGAMSAVRGTSAGAVHRVELQALHTFRLVKMAVAAAPINDEFTSGVLVQYLS